MKIKVNKCACHNRIFEADNEYEKHITRIRKITAFLKRYPKVSDRGCRFANGGWCVQRTEEWYRKFVTDLSKLVKVPKEYRPFTYGFFRYLDDSDSEYYGVATRLLNICGTCYREWGQPYFANHCKHRDKAVEA